VPPEPAWSCWLGNSPTFSESEKLEIISFGKHKQHEFYGPINDPEWFTLVTQNAPSNIYANPEA
jgi:hypothetical protein